MRSKNHTGTTLAVLLVLLAGVSAGAILIVSALNRNQPGAPRYAKNQFGETYGSLADASVPGTEPVLIKALGADGKTVGYVRSTDLMGDAWLTPQEETEQEGKAHQKFIPLYKEDGRTVIGTYEMEPDDEDDGAVAPITAAQSR